MNDKLKVLFIDPSYDEFGLTAPAIPLGLGVIASYLKKNVPGVEIKILKLLTSILKFIREERLDVLAISNYMWNTQLCVKISKIAREINPDLLLIFGGPDINNKHINRERFIKLYAHADLLVEAEGEMAFTNIIQTYLRVHRDRTKLRESISELGNCFYINSDNNLISGFRMPKINDLNSIPSPYLMGLFDEFLANEHFQPLFETNRGCPYNCTYCQQGDHYYSKVSFKSLEYVTKELNYISERVDPDAGLYIIDTNWGMFKQDIPIAKHLRYLNETKNWPKYIDCDTGKSQYDRIRHVALNILPGLMSISNSFQSMDSNVLNNIKRRQIKDPVQIIHDFKSQTQQPDFILPLPGETKKGFISGLKKLLDTGVNVRFRVHPTQMLSATELDTEFAIKKYGIQYKYRQHSNFMGHCDGEFLCEMERVILATKDMSFNDVFYCRVYTVLLDTLLRRAPLRELFAYLKSIGVLVSDLAIRLVDDLSVAPASIVDCMKEYHDSYMETMFDSEEGVIKYMEKHQQDYLLGNKGGDLLKYSMKLWIDHYSSMMEWLFNTVRELIKKKDDDVLEKIDNLETYTRHLYYDRVQQHPPYPTIEAHFDYDILKWYKTNPESPLENFKYPVSYVFKKTNLSGICRVEVWNSFGFYRSELYSPPVGTDSRYYLYKLRRDIEALVPSSSNKLESEVHSYMLSI